MKCPDGAFAYKFAAGPAKYYPVVNRAIFTKALLDEELSDNEAWVVVRTDIPEIEVPVVFDKMCSLAENLETNAHNTGISGPALRSRVGKDSEGGLSMTYEQWQSLLNQGTVTDPWIIDITVPWTGNNILHTRHRL